MNFYEKLNAFSAGIYPDETTDAVSGYHLELAGAKILNRLYPFGYAEGTQVPTHHEYDQVALAIELYTQRGAEGQTSHSENGATRIWPTESQILARIIPYCGSVISNA